MSDPRKQLILISGGSGFIGTHVVHAFLKSGYAVRTTVRSDSKAEEVRKHAPAGTSSDDLSFAIVPDIAVDGAFDQAVQGVDGVIHTASPFVLEGINDNEKELLLPAIDGTLSILKSIAKFATQVKRVVITSSFASILDLSKELRPGYVYSEKDWNPDDYETAKNGNASVAYCASKALAEKSAFDFVEKIKPEFSISTICPPMVYGPPAHAVTTKTLSTSVQNIYDITNGSSKDVPPTAFYAWVDVRDVAAAHVKAYAAEKSGRFLIAEGLYSFQQVADIINRDFPERADRTAKGNPGEPLPPTYQVDNSKSKRELGMTYIGLEQSTRDIVEVFKQIEARE